MKIELDKSSGRSLCRSTTCAKDPEFINENGRIRKDTICAIIHTRSASGGHSSYYCRGCIDKLYQDMKKILNPQLWIFH